MTRLAYLVVTVALGCSTGNPPPTIAPDEPRLATAPPSAQPAPPPAESAPAPPPSAAIATAPPSQAPRHPAGIEASNPVPPPPPIGDACPADPTWCGKSGKVAVVREQIRMRHVEPPCTPIATSPRKPEMDATQACIDGERVFVASACVVCRVPSQDRLVGLVADMTPVQLAAAQKLGGLPEKPLLTTIAAWKTAIASSAKPHAPAR